MQITPDSKFGIWATFEHTCGHKVPMFYAAEEFAKFDQKRQEEKSCVHCNNSEILAKMKAEKQ